MTRRHEPELILPVSRYGRDRRRWLAARRDGITATDAAGILGVDPWESPLSLYAAKTTGTETAVSEAMYWGTRLERVVAEEWGRRNKHLGRVLPTPGLLAHRDRTWQRATLDRYVGRVTDLGAGIRAPLPVAVLECKTTDARHKEHWPEDGSPPLRVIAQVMHQLIVTGLDVGYVAVLIGGNHYREWRIDYDPELADQITAAEEEFLDRVRNGDPPAPSGHDADDAALDVLFTADPGAAQVPIEPSLIAEHRYHKQVRDDADREARRVANLIKYQLGDATEGVDPDTKKTVVTYRETTRDGYTVAPTTYRALRFTRQKESKNGGD